MRGYWRQTGGIVLLVAGFGMCSAFAWIQGGNLAYRLWGAVTCLLVLSAIFGLIPLKPIEVGRALPDEPQMAGGSVLVRLNIRTRRFWPGLFLTVRDALPPTMANHSDPEFLCFPGWTRPEPVHYRLDNLPRGLHRFSTLSVSTGDFLGFFSRRRDLPSDQVLTVWPARVELPRSGWAFGGTGPGPLRGLRPYVPGDSLNQIHWPASAKSGRWMVREWDPPTAWEVNVILDHIATFSADSWELALSVTASIADWAIAGDHPFSLYDCTTRVHLAPASGPAHRDRVMDFLAEAPRHGQATGETAPLLGRATQHALLVTGRAPGAIPWPEFLPDRYLPIGGAGGLERLSDLPRVWARRRA